jgi:hypothetical protein
MIEGHAPIKLTAAIEELFRFLDDRGHVVPGLQVALVELSAQGLLPTGQYAVKPGALQTVEEYAERFAALQRAGFAWLNVTCLGVANQRLIVGVELPSTRTGAARPSINYSGPENRVLKAGWSAAGVLRVE